MTKKQRKVLKRIIIGGSIFLLSTVIQISNPFMELFFYLISYVIIGEDVIVKAVRNIGHGQIFDENFLMTLATGGAFCVSNFSEGVAVMLFYQIGELFQNIAVNHSRKSISNLMNLCPDYANIETGGKMIQVDPKELDIGDTIVIKPGERVPLDGIVLSGTSYIDTSALTGESMPKEVMKGHEIYSGCINQTSLLRVKVQKKYEDSTVAKILNLVENASSKKSKSENFITKFAKYYTPCIVLGACFLALLPPLLFPHTSLSDWIHRALIFLVVSCPCALVISVPLTFFSGIGAASKQGILVKGSNYLEALAKAEIIAFDKTGTLTNGTFRVTKIHPIQISSNLLLKYAAMAESYSNHPISISLKTAYHEPVDISLVEHVKEISGQGVNAYINGITVAVGNEKLMRYVKNFTPCCETTGTVLYVALNSVYTGYIIVSDELKEDSKYAIQKIHSDNIKTVMLTGDLSFIGNEIGKQLGIKEVFTELLPADKVVIVEQLLLETSPSGKVIFVGDGINDAPVLSRADIGITMGAIGSDAAIEAADIVLMTDEPSKIVTAIEIARKTMKIVHQNILFALSIKIGVLILGALGMTSMWAAVFADVGVSVIAILNAMRALRTNK